MRWRWVKIYIKQMKLKWRNGRGHVGVVLTKKVNTSICAKCSSPQRAHRETETLCSLADINVFENLSQRWVS